VAQWFQIAAESKNRTGKQQPSLNLIRLRARYGSVKTVELTVFTMSPDGSPKTLLKVTRPKQKRGSTTGKRVRYKYPCRKKISLSKM
jgi:hypothetical protein